jgi:hypothetical protein
VQIEHTAFKALQGVLPPSSLLLLLPPPQPLHHFTHFPIPPPESAQTILKTMCQERDELQTKIRRMSASARVDISANIENGTARQHVGSICVFF